MKSSKFVGITIPKTLFDKIELLRKDLPRSYIYKKLLESSYSSDFSSHLALKRRDG